MTEPACPKTSDIEQYIDRIYRLELKLKQSQTEHENEREYHKEEIDEHLKTIESLEKSKHDLYCQMKQLNSQVMPIIKGMGIFLSYSGVDE